VLKKIIIIGATSAIAEHCARQWVEDSPKTIVLLGRDFIRTHRVKQDLSTRSPQSDILVETLDFIDSEKILKWVDQTCEADVPDIVLIAHGSLPDQDQCQNDLFQNQQALELNGVSPVLFAEAFAGYMEKANKGKLAIIGSVAGDRGRKSNYVYGAAKGLVNRYVQGLQHRFSGTNVNVILIKPGPTDTPMTAHLKSKGVKLADVNFVANCIIEGIERVKPVIYAPAKWAIIMMVIRHLPRFIFNKLNI
jgi:decaprenylphospho-beta-D-erythro-pentofuranosid-2-ulose 2-reductase